jgi:hypothetical protein
LAAIDLIKKDSRVRKLLRMLDKGRFAFDCEQVVTEIQGLHINRRGLQLTVKEVIHQFQSKLLDAILHAQANRSRIVQLKMEAFRIHARLDKHCGLIKQHLKSQYSTQLNHMGGTAADRESILSTILEPALAHIKDLKVVIDIADIAINDLDQAGWSIKSVINVFEQTAERKAPKL